jgi:hypothetical protein
MAPRKVAFFIALDLAALIAVLLALVYFGMSHLLLLIMGLGFLLLTFYDLRSGNLSALFSDLVGFSDPAELGSLKWLPVILSTLLIILSLPVFIEHGFINDTQRWAMQNGQFARVAIPAIAGGAAVIAVAVWTVYSGSKKN